LIEPLQVAALVTAFDDEQEPAAQKSRELILQMLEHTPAPFSRKQFQPGHITCTGLVLHPERDAILLVHHRRLDRWLLPGGHVETSDAQIWDTARREVTEETGALLAPADQPPLVGVDIHGIPPGRGEPFHLHHDLIFGFHATSVEIGATEEVRSVLWCEPGEWDYYDVPLNIRLARQRMPLPRAIR
jgi:8-oxo-dGTP pyrophosphatase MutT (NUDIX family)